MILMLCHITLCATLCEKGPVLTIRLKCMAPLNVVKHNVHVLQTIIDFLYLNF